MSLALLISTNEKRACMNRAGIHVNYLSWMQRELFDVAFNRLQEIFNLETLEDMQQSQLLGTMSWLFNQQDGFFIHAMGIHHRKLVLLKLGS